VCTFRPRTSDDEGPRPRFYDGYVGDWKALVPYIRPQEQGVKMGGAGHRGELFRESRGAGTGKVKEGEEYGQPLTLV